jgi:hypothetical protein
MTSELVITKVEYMNHLSFTARITVIPTDKPAVKESLLLVY